MAASFGTMRTALADQENELSDDDFISEDNESESRGIQSVEIAGQLIDVLCTAPKDTALKQLSALAGMPPSKAHRYMASLVRIGIARQDDNGRYNLGPLALRLGLAAIGQSDIIQAAGRATEKLARELGLSVHLNVWGDWGPVVVRLEQGPSPVISTVRLGSVLPLTRSATGLVYLAFSNPSITSPVVERELAAHALPIDRDELASRVEATRAQGFAAVGGLLIPGLAAICAPVFDFQNELACAITVTGADVTITDPAGRFVEQLCSNCAKISAEFGSTAPHR
ncbi:MAG: IclR family transcriptional regulator [Pseudomonadota bacterium]